MKTLAKLLTFCLLVSIVAACGTTAQPTSAPQATNEPAAQPTTAAEPALSPAEEWAKANGFGPYQPAEEDWAAIEAAAKKEGKVVVYCNSSKFEKLLDSWKALYPDIALEGGDTDDIAVKMAAEQEAGNVVGDIWYNSDGHLLYGEFAPKQWLWSYVPPGVEVEDVTADRPFAVVRHGVDVIGYNSEIRKDGCPVNNWWQFTEPALKGKFFLENPAADASTTAKIALIVQHADEMAAAYQSLYGKDWTADEAYGDDTPNAGYLFLKKLAKNEPGLQPGGDEVDAAFATLGMDPNVEPGYGWTGLSSLETTMDGELAMAPCYGLQPVVGILKSTYLAVANKSTHPNAVKLFIKFALSEDGLKPWNQIGNYPTVKGIEPAEGMPPREDLKLWPSDDLFGYQNASQVRDFWSINLLAP